ncbi:MAG: hypothetical protein AMJ79_12560 [Phycisphaerae bacterium SM23_30]|nr:MAG: hypothetical protein AMJ79_12560 [Phycisphaerae bacterium SM23_30]
MKEGEIEFTTIKPGAPGSPYGADAIYSKVIIGGNLPEPGVGGIAESVDRHNADRTDTALILTDALGYLAYYQRLDEDLAVRFNQTVNAVANTAAHELGHILGLQHATEVNTATPANIMGYNYEVDLAEQEFRERNSFLDFAEQRGYFEMQPGFANEIDMLLRAIGSGTAMGW